MPPVQLGAVEVSFSAPGAEEVLSAARRLDREMEKTADSADEAAAAVAGVGRNTAGLKGTQAAAAAAETAVRGTGTAAKQAGADIAAAASRATEALSAEAAALSRLRNTGNATAADLQRLASVERQLTVATRDGTKSAVDRAKALTGLDAVAKKTASGLDGLFAGIGAGIVFSRVTALAGAIFKAGTTAEETGAKFNATFLEAAGQVDAFIDGYARLAGLSKTEAREITATIGAMARGLGAATPEAARLSEQVLRLAGDLTSFNNVPIEDALIALRAGLIGEAEPMRRFGVVLSEAAVSARALADSGKASADALTPLDKMMARVAITTEQMKVQLGDLERTQGSAANRARALQADFKNLRDEVAVGLSGSFDIFLGVLGKVVGALSGSGGLAAALTAATLAFGAMLAPLLAVRTAMFVMGAQTIPALIASLGALLGSPWGIALLGIATAVGAIGYAAAQSKIDLDEMRQRMGAFGDLVPLADQMNEVARKLSIEQGELSAISQIIATQGATEDLTARLKNQQNVVKGLSTQWESLNAEYQRRVNEKATGLATPDTPDAGAAKETVDALKSQAAALSKLKDGGKATAKDLAELARVERALVAVVNDGTRSAADRADALAALDGVSKRLGTDKLTKTLADQAATLVDLARAGQATAADYAALEGITSKLASTVARSTASADDRLQATKALQDVEKTLAEAVASGTMAVTARTAAEALLLKTRSALAATTAKAAEFQQGDNAFYEQQSRDAANRGGASLAMQGVGGLPPMRKLSPDLAKLIIADLQAVPALVTPAMQQLGQQLQGIFETGVAFTLADSITGLFTSIFNGEGISAGFASFGKIVLAGLGTVFSQMGAAMIAASPIFKAIAAAMTNPFTAGPALLAFGAALVALGASLGAIAKGKGGGGAAYRPGTISGQDQTVRVTLDRRTPIVVAPGITVPVGSTGATEARGITPMPPVVNNVTVIGPNDPVAQRQVLQLVRNGEARGY